MSLLLDRQNAKILGDILIAMTDEAILGELESIADKLQIEIRYEPLDGRGGLCKVRGETFVIVNESLPVEEKVKVIASELSNFNTTGIFMLPKVREIIKDPSHRNLLI